MKKIEIKISIDDVSDGINGVLSDGKEVSGVLMNPSDWGKLSLDILKLDTHSTSLVNVKEPFLLGYPVFRTSDLGLNTFIVF